MAGARFMLAGEGAPLLAIARHLAERENSTIAGIATSPERSDWLSQFPHSNVVAMRDFASGLWPPADWLININSETILPSALLSHYEHRALNLHNGPLPQYAGRHVTQWGIRNGEKEFAATVHFMAGEVDTGDIVAERHFPIRASDTGLSLFVTSF